MRKEGKALHNIPVILDVGTHRPQQLVKGYRFKKVPSSVAYVAHVRNGLSPPNSPKSC